jgi:hypothetical protein
MPLLSSLSCLVTALGAVLYFHGFVAGLNIQLFGFFFDSVLHVFLMKRRC